MNYKNCLLLFFVSITMTALGQQQPIQIYEEDGKFGLKDATEEILVKPVYLDIKMSNFGIFAIQSENRKWAIFDRRGVRVTAFVYDRMEQKLPNVIEVRQGAKVGLVSDSGQLLIPVEYDKVSPIGKVILTEKGIVNNSMRPKTFVYRGAIVTNKSLSGFINGTGKQVLPLNYERVKATAVYELALGSVEVVGLVINKNGKYGIVNENGEMILPMEYEYINALNKVGFGQIKKNGKEGLYNKQLKIVLPPQFDDVKLLNENIFAGRKGNIWTVADIGNSTKIYAQVNDIYPFRNGYAKVLKDGKVGVMAKDGKVKVPFEYDTAVPFGRNVLLTKGTKNFIYTNKEKIKPWKYSMDISWQNLEDKLKPVKTPTGKYGYINDDGKLVIEAVYEEAKEFREGVAIVGKNGKFGFINEKGRIILNIEYELPDYQYEPSVLLIKKEDKYGYIDYQGKFLVAINYEAIAAYADIMKAKKNGQWGYIDNHESVLVAFDFDYLEAYETNKTNIRYQKGNVLGWLEKEIADRTTEKLSEWADEVGAAKNGVQTVRVGQLYGLIRTNGEWLVPIRFQNKIVFDAYGKAIVRENNRWGMIDKNGKEVIPTIYDEKMQFNDKKLACVRQNGRYGVIDFDGNVLVSPVYESYIYTDYEYWTVKKEDKFGITNSKGHLIIPIEYEKVFPYVNHIALAKKNDKWGYINELNQVVIPFEYQVLNSFINGRAIAKKGDYWGMINETNDAILPFKYDNLIEEANGYINVSKGGLWGIIDAKSNIIIPFEYHKITALNEYFRVDKNSRIGLYTQDGQMILPAFYDALTVNDYGFKVEKDKKYGLLDFDGSVIFPAIYDELMYFSAGYSRVKKGAYYGMISQKGVLSVPCEYANLGIRFRGAYIEAKKKGKWGVINKTGKTIIPFQYEKINWVNDTQAEGYLNGKPVLIDF